MTTASYLVDTTEKALTGKSRHSTYLRVLIGSELPSIWSQNTRPSVFDVMIVLLYLTTRIAYSTPSRMAVSLITPRSSREDSNPALVSS